MDHRRFTGMQVAANKMTPFLQKRTDIVIKEIAQNYEEINI